MTNHYSEEIQARYQAILLVLMAQVMTAVACVAVALIAWLSGAIA